MTARQNVQLHIISEADGQTIRQTVTADRYDKGAAVYLRYSEAAEEMGRTMTMVRIAASELRMIRQGDVESELTFVPGGSRVGFYRTSQGRIELETITKELRVQWQGAQGSVSWSYELRAGGEAAGRFVVKLEVRESQQD